MKRGFTLIELLAVLVIIVIIMAIATPIILNIIDDSRNTAIERTVDFIIDGAEKFYTTDILDSANSAKFDGETNLYDEIVMSGNKPDHGVVFIDSEGKIFVSVFENNKCYIKNFEDNKITINEEKTTIEVCLTLSNTLYKEEILNGADPVIAEGLYPVIIDTLGNVTFVDESEQWYDYETKKWANAVTLKNPTGEKNIDNISAYFVWIPKYEYKMQGKEEEILINFVQKGATASESYIMHEAFTFGTDELSGIWVGKFEITGDDTNVTVLPNVTSLRAKEVSEFFNLLLEFDTKYNLEGKVDSHMMKNSEWGAVAYLSHSKYGLNAEVTKNSNCSFLTGNGDYVSNINQSTSGNITGIYDMSGGSWEYVMGNYNNTTGASGLNLATVNTKYYNTYSSESSEQKGHALNETAGWYGDYSDFVRSSYPWFIRGDICNSTTLAGVFAFNDGYGSIYNNGSTRLVLVQL